MTNYSRERFYSYVKVLDPIRFTNSSLLKPIITLCLVFFSVHTLLAVDWYISPTGNDSDGDGSVGSPWHTLHKARDMARTRKNEPVTIYLMDGTYYLEATLNFTESDSRSSTAPLTFMAIDGAEPVVHGGKTVSGWNTEGNLFYKDLGPDHYYFKNLFKGNERRTRARTPNLGSFYRVAKSLNSRTQFEFHPGDINSSWTNLNEVNVNVYYNWWAHKGWIKNVTGNTVELEQGVWAIGGVNDEQRKSENRARYYIENIFEGLDSPGEWYYNHTSGRLYYYPMPGETPSVELHVPLMTHLIDIQGGWSTPVTYINFEGLAFNYADWKEQKTDAYFNTQAHKKVKSAMINMYSAQHITFLNCEIAHGGGYGITMQPGSQNNMVQKCHIYDLGAGGVYMGTNTSQNSSAFPQASQRISNNTVDNCFIHNTSNVWHGSVSIYAELVADTKITNNEISDNDYSGISFGWRWNTNSTMAENNLIQYNHVHHCLQGYLGDGGGIYILGNQPGTRILDNKVHDIVSEGKIAKGIYLDQGAAGITIARNWVYNTHYGFTSKGRDNIWHDNIFAFLFYHKGLGDMDAVEFPKKLEAKRNIVLTQYGVTDHVTGDLVELDQNLYWDINSGEDIVFGTKTFAEYQAVEDANGRVADPKFVDPWNYDFRLQSGSPALELGFVETDPAKFGLYGDAEWTRLPENYDARPVYQGKDGIKYPLHNTPEWFDDFESYELGSNGATSLEAMWPTKFGPEMQSLHISDRKAKSGTHSLRFDNVIRADRTHVPMGGVDCYFMDPGQEILVEFDVLLESGAELRFRTDPQYKISVLLTNENAGTNTWTHVKVEHTLGENTYTRTIGEEVSTVAIEGADHRIKDLRFITNNSESDVYLDNLRIVGGNGEDKISEVTAPKNVTRNDTVSVTVNYVASRRRDLSVNIQDQSDNYKTYGHAKTTVNPGQGAVTLKVAVAEEAPPHADYQWQTVLTPVNKEWDERVGNLKVDSVEVNAAGTLFYVRNKATGRYLRPAGDQADAHLQVADDDNSDWFVWEKVRSDQNFFALRNKRTGMYFQPSDENDGTLILQKSTNEQGHWTQWEPAVSDDGVTFHLKHRPTGKHIRPQDGAPVSPVELRPSSWTGDWTRWSLVPLVQTATAAAEDSAQLSGISRTSGIALYPNPVKRGAVLMLALPERGYHVAEIYTLSGHLVQQQPVPDRTQQLPIVISSRLTKGLYLIKLTGQNKNLMHKILVE